MSSIAESYNKKGAQLYREQLYAEAILTFSKGFELEPENVTILCNRSAAYEAVHKSQEALKDAELALHINPKYIKAYYRKSKALFLIIESNKEINSEETIKLWTDLLECIEVGLQIDPEYTELLDYKNVILNHPKYLSYLSPKKDLDLDNHLNDKENIFNTNEENCENNCNNNNIFFNEKVQTSTPEVEQSIPLINDVIENEISEENLQKIGNNSKETITTADQIPGPSPDRLSSLYQISSSLSSSMNSISTLLTTKTSSQFPDNDDTSSTISDVEDSCFPNLLDSDSEEGFVPFVHHSPSTIRNRKRSASAVCTPIITSFIAPKVAPVPIPLNNLSSSLPSHSSHPNINSINIINTTQPIVHKPSLSATINIPPLATPSSTSTSISTSFTLPNTQLNNANNTISSPTFSTLNSSLPTPSPFSQILVKTISSTSQIVTSFTTTQSPPLNQAIHIVKNNDNQISRSLSGPGTLQSNDPISPPKSLREPMFVGPSSPPNSSNFSVFIKSTSPTSSLHSSTEDFDLKFEKKNTAQPITPSSPPTLSPLADHDKNERSSHNNHNNNNNNNSSNPNPVSHASTTTTPNPSTSSSLSNIMEPIAMVAKSLLSTFSKDKKKDVKEDEAQKAAQKESSQPIIADTELIKSDSSDLKLSNENNNESEDSANDLPPIEQIDQIENLEINKVKSHVDTKKENNNHNNNHNEEDHYNNNNNHNHNNNHNNHNSINLNNSANNLPRLNLTAHFDDDSDNDENENDSTEELWPEIVPKKDEDVEPESISKKESISLPNLSYLSRNKNSSFSSPDIFFYVQNDNAFNSKGVEFFKNRKFSEAITCFNKAIEINPDNYFYYINRSAAKLSSGECVSALEDVEKSIMLYPRDPIAYTRKAEIYIFLNNPRLAKQTLEDAMGHLSLSDKEKEEFEKGIKLAGQKESSELKFLRITSKSNDSQETFDSLFNFLPRKPIDTQTKSKLELTNFISPVPVFRKVASRNRSKGDEHEDIPEIIENLMTENLPEENQKTNKKEKKVVIDDSKLLNISDLVNDIEDENLSPRFIARLREKRSQSIPIISVNVDHKMLVLVDKDGKRLSYSDNQYLFNQIENNRFWNYLNAQLKSGKLSLFNSMNGSIHNNDLIFLLPQSSSIPADPTPLDEYYESHFAFIQNAAKAPQNNNNNNNDPQIKSNSNGNNTHNNNTNNTNSNGNTLNNGELTSSIDKNEIEKYDSENVNDEKFTFKTLNQIEGIISKNKITILKNPFDRMLGADGQEFNMKGPVSIDIITESYLLVESFSYSQPSDSEEIVVPIKLLIIGTSIYPSEVEKIFSNFVLLEEEIKEKMEKKNKAIALMEVYWKNYQDDRSANIRASIDKFTNDFRKKPPNTLEEKAKRFNDFTLTIMNDLKENELWKSSPKEEIDCAIFNLRKQILSQLTDLLHNENKEDDKKLKKIIRRLNNFVKPEHIGLPPHDGTFDDSVYSTAKAEMNAIGEFTSPREKLECLLNCCRIINFQITSMGNIANADELLPRLILLIIHTNPPQLSSSLKFIQLFCEKTDELAEAFYYVTMVESAVYFILNVTGKQLNISEDLFEQYMAESPTPTSTPTPLSPVNPSSRGHESVPTSPDKKKIDSNHNNNNHNNNNELSIPNPLVSSEPAPEPEKIPVHSDVPPAVESVNNNNDQNDDHNNHPSSESEALNLNYFTKDAQEISTTDISKLLFEYKKLVSIVQSMDPSLLHFEHK